eukprot:7299932-Prymnesium_polylepis.1
MRPTAGRPHPLVDWFTRSNCARALCLWVFCALGARSRTLGLETHRCCCSWQPCRAQGGSGQPTSAMVELCCLWAAACTATGAGGVVPPLADHIDAHLQNTSL